MTRRALGVVGTLVWDRFTAPGERAGPREEWGGIAYALATLPAVLPDPWRIVPIVRVGSDLAAEARAFLASLERVEPDAIVVVPEPNNRVEIRYRSASERTERLTGGVSPWTAAELAPRIARCDALHVNFISGFEMGLDTARALAAAFRGPVYADLHSLFLGVDDGGVRVPRRLPSAAHWLRCFDAVQLNEAELALLLGGDAGAGPGSTPAGPGDAAVELLARGPKLVAVTLGEAGAVCAARRGLPAQPLQWADVGPRGGPASEPPSPPLRAPADASRGDPTGCGDVWGAALYGRLLAGDLLPQAVATANRVAAVNVDLRGADALARHLAAEPAPVGRAGERR